MFKTYIKKSLLKYSYLLSQAGQDYWVYGEVFNEKKKGFFLDIGAHDGIYISNTYLLESKYKWSGICIEANPVTFEQLKKNRNSKCLNLCLDESDGEVNFVLRGKIGGIVGLDDNAELSSLNPENVIRIKTVPLIKVLDENNAPKVIDYLSIDVEGAEERILGKFDFNKYIFRSITIERPTHVLRDLFKKNGYMLIKEIPDLDCFYIHTDFLEDYKKNQYEFYRKKIIPVRWSNHGI